MSVAPLFTSLVTNAAGRAAINSMRTAGTRYLPTFLGRIFNAPRAPINRPIVRIVSFREMQRISERNFERRIEQIVSEKM